MRFPCLLAMLLYVACFVTPALAASRFVRLVEAEHFPASNAFTKSTDRARKVTYLTSDERKTGATENAAMIGSLSVPAAGAYYLWARTSSRRGGSLFFKVGAGRSAWLPATPSTAIAVEGDWLVWQSPAGAESDWSWSRVGPCASAPAASDRPGGFKLEKGRHRLCIASGAGEIRIDKVLITDDAALVPHGPEGIAATGSTKTATGAHGTPPPPPGLIRPLLTKKPFTRPSLALTATIALDDLKPGPAEVSRTVKGGRWENRGWQATSPKDQLRIELKEGFGPRQSGAIEVDITNFCPLVQAVGSKHHFITLHGDAGGDAFVSRDSAFVTLRAGGQYIDEKGKLGIKVLWRGGSGRGEEGTFGARDWTEAETYTWRCEWNDQALCVYLDGKCIFGPAEFSGRFSRPMKHLFLGTDGIGGEAWFGMIGPVYRAVRLYH